MIHLGVFINNTDSEVKYKINLNNFLKLNNNFTKTIIFDNDDDLFSKKLKNDIINNNNIYKYLMDDTNDINNISNKLLYILKEIKSEYFKYITIIDDGYIYIDSINDYIKYIEKHNMEFYSYIDSSENKYHYNLQLYSFKSKLINKIMCFLDKYDNKDNNFIYDFTNQFKTKISYLKVAYLKQNLKINIFYNDLLLEYFLKNKIINVIKVDKLYDIQKKNKNEKNIYEKIPEYFDIEIYKNHNDLKELSDNKLYKHFLEFGQFEIRNYCKNNYLLPYYIREILKNCNNLLEYFDVPDDFNVYNYKENNPDLSYSNKSEYLLDWVNSGKNEGRTYSSNN